MLENLCLNKRKNKSAKFSENLNALSKLRNLLLRVGKGFVWSSCRRTNTASESYKDALRRSFKCPLEMDFYI
jgi:hypothetical protein